MHRFLTSCLGLAALIIACGAPAELDEGLFPASYSDDETGSAGSAPLGGTGGSVAGTGGAPPVGGGGSGIPAGGSGAPAVAAGAGGTPVAAGGAGAAPGGDCPADITVLFNRQLEDGGCAGGLCHQPGGTRPDLISPDPLSRLVGVASNCNGLPYIGTSPDDSLISLKITTPPAGCGLAMPFSLPDALSPAEEACILAWVADNAGG